MHREVDVRPEDCRISARIDVRIEATEVHDAAEIAPGVPRIDTDAALCSDQMSQSRADTLRVVHDQPAPS